MKCRARLRYRPAASVLLLISAAGEIIILVPTIVVAALLHFLNIKPSCGLVCDVIYTHTLVEFCFRWFKNSVGHSPRPQRHTLLYAVVVP